MKKLALPIACAFLVASCGSTTEAQDLQPIFDLDRQPASGVAPVDADRTDVIAAPLLRSYLQNLLTAHSDLSIQAMREATTGAVNPLTLEQLTQNTDELTGAVGLVYGPEGAAAFDQLWTSHIEFFNSYASARGSGDEAAIAEAGDALDHYENDFSSYIDIATSGNADFHAVLHVLHSHVGQLLSQADSWAAGDFETAIALSTEAHRHMDVIAEALAVGIATQQPAAFPGTVTAADSSDCASLQLETSVLISLEHQAQLAASVGDQLALNATEGALREAQAESRDLALEIVSASSAASVSERLALSRSALAQSEGCTGLVLG